MIRHQVIDNQPVGQYYSLPYNLTPAIALKETSTEGYLRSQGSYPCEVIQVDSMEQAYRQFDGDIVTVYEYRPVVKPEYIYKTTILERIAGHDKLEIALGILESNPQLALMWQSSVKIKRDDQNVLALIAGLELDANEILEPLPEHYNDIFLRGDA